ncbi:hypothetical protein HY78_00425 [Rhizorhabdus wittichii DC-6]|nr:hypothetical protein HY78_00425 [Rhizorhabdus wittichii DC-6]
MSGVGSADAKGLARIADHTGASMDYLVRGIGAESGDWETHEPDVPAGSVRVPIYPMSVGAGGGRAVLEAEPDRYVVWPEDLLRAYGRPEDLKLFPIIGDSMMPELHDGGLVLINEGERQPRDGIVMARLGDDLLIKRMRLLGGGRAELVSINPAYPPIPVNLVHDDFAIIGKAALGFKGL